jgi:PAS domain S-box-containing protein
MENNIYKNRRTNFFFRIILPTLLAISLFILTIFFIIIPNTKKNILNGKQEMIRELTNSAWSILAKYEMDEKNGLLSREEAQKTAVSRIQYLRYGEENKDYFWITDLKPIMIMHPYRKDLDGKDLSEFKDPHGKKLFVEMVEVAKQHDHGYVNYMWQWKDDSTHIVPKLSYVKIFKPWNWIIGTGVYIEDVKKEIASLTNKLIKISVGISIIVALLLIFITQQSLKSETRRKDAEMKLKESKEKYQTLVEATTEGLIMLIDGKISFLNNLICNLTGIDNTELLNQPLNVLISEKNNREIINVFSKNIVEEGQYEIFLKKKNGGVIEVLAIASTAMFYEKEVNIIIVKDITVDRSANLTGMEYQKLLNNSNIGYFRAKIDNKGQFLYADDTTIRILGYHNFRELSEVFILEMLLNADDRKTLRNSLIESGTIKNKTLRIRKQNGDLAVVLVTLVVLNNENFDKLTCDGIIEDISACEFEKAASENLIADLRYNDFLMEQSVKNYISSYKTLDADATISDVVKVLSKRNNDCLFLTRNENEFIGIITNTDIQKRVLTLNLKLDNPAYLIMSSPVVSITENTSISDAISIGEEKNINHLLVKNVAGEISGILRMNDLNKALKDSLSFFLISIRKAETIDELKHQYSKLQLFVKPLINSEVSVKNITQITSSFSDQIIKRILELSIQEIGDPPAEFSFICLGSEGRLEETLFTDQDNAIIFEDVSKENEARVKEYFNELGERVCNSLNQVGYAFCQGNIMAKNPQWCQPVSVWEKYFANWITTPEPQNLLDATIFFDFRNIFGNEDLTIRLRDTVSAMVKQHPLFLYHLAYNTSTVKTQQLSSVNLTSDKNAEVIDLKNAISLIIMFIRTYSLQNAIWTTNTIERLEAIKRKNLINAATADEIQYAYNFLMKLRFGNQVNLIENGLPLSNILNTRKVIEIELSVLKKVLSLLPVYQNKIRIDFRIAN